MSVRYEIGALVGAAEATISAAAAALVWSTGDAHGVLAHVAAADPTLMAGTRLVYERLAAGRTIRDVTVNLCEDYRTAPRPLEEVAALPWLVAPEWNSQVVAALRAHKLIEGFDRAAQAARAEQSVVDWAIQTCHQWCRDPLPLDRIMYWADGVSGSADWCWRYENAQR